LAEKPTTLFFRQELAGIRRFGHTAASAAVLPSNSWPTRWPGITCGGDTHFLPCGNEYADHGPQPLAAAGGYKAARPWSAGAAS